MSKEDCDELPADSKGDVAAPQVHDADLPAERQPGHADVMRVEDEEKSSRDRLVGAEHGDHAPREAPLSERSGSAGCAAKPGEDILRAHTISENASLSLRCVQIQTFQLL